MHRTGDVVRALAATFALAALVIGLPVLLITAVGWPLPRQLPRLHDIADTFGGHRTLETATVWKVLAVILWLAWLQIAAAVLTELVAAARGGLPRTIPGLHLGHGLVAPLIATVVLAWPAGGASRAAAATAPPPIAASPPPAAAPTASAEDAAATATPAPAGSTIEHVVQRRDTLWDLAERYLGDGYRASELFELNRGRPQPDGNTLTDPGVIRPGWVLQIPQPNTPQPSTPGRSVIVEPGDTLWEIAAEELHDGHRFGEIVELNVGRPQPDGGALTDPDVIRPGWTVALPSEPTAVASPAPAVPPTPAPSPPPEPVATPPAGPSMAPTPGPAAPAAAPTPDSTAARLDQADDDGALAVPAAGLAALGVGAAGVVAALERRRRVQQRRRARGEHPAPVSDAAAATERLLRTAARPSQQHALDAALRAAAAGAPAALALVDHVEVRGDDVTLVLAREMDPPAGFVADEGPHRWRASADTDALAELGAASPAPLPALIPAGRTAESVELFIDGEAHGVVFVHGDPRAVDGVVRAVAAAVATAAWVDAPEVVLVGDDPALGQFAPAVSADLAEALDSAERRARAVADAVDAAGAESAVQARLSSPTPEVFAPVVVVSTARPSQAELERLRSLAGGRGGAVAVVPVDEPPDFGRTIAVGADGAATIVGLERTRPGVIDDDHVAVLTELFEAAAASTPASAPDMAPSAGPATTAPVTQLSELLSGVDVVVRVLGEVGAVRLAGGVEEPLVPSKQKALEAVVYLALRETAVDRDGLQAALWPAGANSAKTFHNAVWEARRMLGSDGDGADLLPDPIDGRYALSDRVVTDYGLLHELVATAGDADDPEVAAALLTEALQLVRGEPFTGAGRGYAWVAPHTGIIIAEVVDAAEELASIRLATGDWRAAEWAARQGLKVFPCDERLYRLLMRAAHASGNVAGVQRIFSELLAAVADPDDGVEPEDTVHPETVDLLEELTGRQQRATA